MMLMYKGDDFLAALVARRPEIPESSLLKFDGCLRPFIKNSKRKQGIL